MEGLSRSEIEHILAKQQSRSAVTLDHYLFLNEPSLPRQ